MAEHLPEQDWKRWRVLAPVLLNRFCESAVANATKYAERESSGHEKFLALDRFVAECNENISIVFDDSRRSRALMQIVAAVVRGIMSETELSSFSEETQVRVRRVAAFGG